jgi:hypothetical protein
LDLSDEATCDSLVQWAIRQLTEDKVERVIRRLMGKFEASEFQASLIVRAAELAIWDLKRVVAARWMARGFLGLISLFAIAIAGAALTEKLDLQAGDMGPYVVLVFAPVALLCLLSIAVGYFRYLRLKHHVVSARRLQVAVQSERGLESATGVTTAQMTIAQDLDLATVTRSIRFDETYTGGPVRMIRCAECGVHRSLNFCSCISCGSRRLDIRDDASFEHIIVTAASSLKTESLDTVLARIVELSGVDEATADDLLLLAEERRLKHWRATGRRYINIGAVCLSLAFGSMMGSTIRLPAAEDAYADLWFGLVIGFFGLFIMILGIFRTLESSVPPGSDCRVVHPT